MGLTLVVVYWGWWRGRPLLETNPITVVVERVVDVHINKLRQKIEPEPGRPRYILTARGIGYRFADPLEPKA